MKLPAMGLYAVTSAAVCVDERTLLHAVGQAIEGGAVLVQYRDKDGDAATRLRHALRLQVLCRDAGVPLLINDGPADCVAAQGFDGLHLGRADGSIADARARQPGVIIGATCGNSLQHALDAEAAGASYVAFGAFYGSATKPQAARATIAVLRDARAQLHVPICAIGGITPENGGVLIDAGAHYLAVVEGLFGASDIRAAACAYSELFAG